jgi:hypothetical protein
MAGCALALVTTLAASPASAATGDPVFDQVTWGHASLTVSGTAMALQSLSVHVTDPRANPSNCWEFYETRSGGTGTLPLSWSTATLASGTDSDGVWTTSFYLPSTADGTWTLAAARDCSDVTDPEHPVSGAPTFAVTGHHQPRVTFGYVPLPVRVVYPYVTVKGRVYDADTGAGMPGVQLGRDQDTYCLNDRGDGNANLRYSATTNANGYYAFPVGRVAPGALQCLGLFGAVRHNPDGFAVFVWYRWDPAIHLPYLPAVSAVPAATSAKAGSLVTVNGHIVGASPSCEVDLQRLHGSTAWRTVSTSFVHNSLRIALTAQPPAGRHIYRVLYPHCARDPDQVAASSSRFTITGT